MVVFYQFCGRTKDADGSYEDEYLIACDRETCWLDRETLTGSECMWFVPGFPPTEQ